MKFVLTDQMGRPHYRTSKRVYILATVRSDGWMMWHQSRQAADREYDYQRRQHPTQYVTQVRVHSA